MLTHVYMKWVPLLVPIVVELENMFPSESAAGLVVAFAVTVAFVKQTG